MAHWVKEEVETRMQEEHERQVWEEAEQLVREKAVQVMWKESRFRRSWRHFWRAS